MNKEEEEFITSLDLDEVVDHNDSGEKSSYTFEKILNHPDKDLILEKILSGDPTKSIEEFIKKKYPNSKEKHISYVLIQNFRKNYLGIEPEMLEKIKKDREAMRKLQIHEQNVLEIKSSASYSNHQKMVDREIIDYNTTILGILKDCNDGIEQLKTVSNGKATHLIHTAIATYLSRIKEMMELHYKIVKEEEKKTLGSSGEKIEVLQKEVEVLKETIKEVFLELHPESMPIFATRLKENLKKKLGG